MCYNVIVNKWKRLLGGKIMKKFGKLQFAAGFVLGGLIFGGITAIAANGVLATLSVNKIYVDGTAVNITAYAIEGHNYVQLRDIAEAVDFGVDYDGATNSVIVDSKASYAKPTAVASLQPVVTPAPTASGYPEKSNLWTVNPWTRQALTATATKTRDSFIASLSGLSDLDKLKNINELVCTQMTYDIEYKGVNGNDEQFWTVGSRGVCYGVCYNYATKVLYLCNLAEIPCVCIEGNTNASKTWDKPTHEWNEVYIDGKWEYFDATFSDSDGKQDHFIYGSAEREKRNATDASAKSTLKTKEKKVPGSTT
jgi:hypothetical protein